MPASLRRMQLGSRPEGTVRADCVEMYEPLILPLVTRTPPRCELVE